MGKNNGKSNKNSLPADNFTPSVNEVLGETAFVSSDDDTTRFEPPQDDYKDERKFRPPTSTPKTDKNYLETLGIIISIVIAVAGFIWFLLSLCLSQSEIKNNISLIDNKVNENRSKLDNTNNKIEIISNDNKDILRKIDNYNNRMDNLINDIKEILQSNKLIEKQIDNSKKR